MGKKSYPRLCMGTFISILFATKKRRTGLRSSSNMSNDGLTNPDVFDALMKVIDPGFQRPQKGDAFKVIVSDIKNCKKDKSAYYSPTGLKNSINNRIEKGFNELEHDMKMFVDDYLDRDRCENPFTSAIVYLIQQSTDGNPDDEFLIKQNQRIKRRDITGLSRFLFENIIISICHYILNNVEKNTVGRSTIEYWNETYNGDEFVLLDSLAKEVKLDFPIDNFINESFLKFFGDTELRQIPEADIKEGKEIVEKILKAPLKTQSKYFKNAYKHFMATRTLLYNEKPQPLYDFFVCNRILRTIPGPNGTSHLDTVANATIPQLVATSKYIILSAVGGMGKSIMIRHLFLDAIANYNEYEYTPFLITLKDYKGDHIHFEEYVYEKYQELGGDLNETQFTNLLKDGHCVFLLDGLDEISIGIISTFEDRFSEFFEEYSQNCFIIASRPTEHTTRYNKFSYMRLLPFTLGEALLLIDKLEFREDEPSIKKSFRNDIEDHLYETHKEVASNPLLLTIIILTYEQHGDIPSKMHSFYQRAYITLAEKHDASKGGFRRRFKTKLTSEKLGDYLAEFCARSYFKELFDFSETEFESIFDQLTLYQEDGRIISYSDFSYDLINNICIMYFETEKYHFMHRSFQEYFCALFYSRQKDKSLYRIAKSFEKITRRSSHDQTFGMLYDMIPEKIEEYVFIPVLEATLCADSGNDMDDYWQFLVSQYGVLEYEKGDTFESADNKPVSFLYNFIVTVKNIKGIVNDDFMEEFYDYEEFIWEKYCYYDSSFTIKFDNRGEEYSYTGDNETLTDYADVDEEFKIHYFDPEIVGYLYRMDLSVVLSQKDTYSDIIIALSDYGFPLRREYLLAKAYLAELKSKTMRKNEQDEDDFMAMIESED